MGSGHTITMLRVPCTARLESSVFTLGSDGLSLNSDLKLGSASA